MQRLRGFDDVDLDVPGAVVSIGNFDGVHRGHQAVICSAVDAARDAGLTSVVCTFDPHTRVFLRPDHPPRLLGSLEQRVDAIEELGVDVTVVIPFDGHVAGTPRETFVRDFLCGALRARQLHLSKDFTFGAGGRGDVAYLRRVAGQIDLDLQVIPAVMAGGEPISSTRIRDAVAAGRVEEAAELLGRPFEVAGEVVAGAGRGHELGAPTANLDIGARLAPGHGVYATAARLGGRTLAAVSNVGVRPTFEEAGAVTIETHLLDGDGRSLYGESLRLAFLKRLRDEKRFSGPDELAAQIRRDVEQAGRFFAESGR